MSGPVVPDASDRGARDAIDPDVPGESDDADWLLLDGDESVTWAAGPRLTTILPSVGLGLALVAAGLALGYLIDPRLALLALVGVAPPVASYLAVTNTRFVVTSEALYAKRGVVGRDVDRVPLTKVQNSSFSQGVAGRFIGYGSVTFEEAGGSGLRFYRIEDPQGIRRFVDRRAGRETRAEIPGTPEQWAAVLDEVRALRGAFRDRST